MVYDINKSSTKNLKKLVFDAVKHAGVIALDYEKKELKHWYKSKSQPVTDADIKINSYLKDFLKKVTPNFGWLSEESIDDGSRLEKGTFWCLDPIDGTRSFIAKKPEYTISLALVVKSEPIFGVIYNPRTKEMFSAEKTKGAYCNDRKLKVNDKKYLEDCNLAISQSEYKKINKYFLYEKSQIITMGSIAYKIALVAKGNIDITLSLTQKSDWDLAAASLILEEAGGIITKKNGDPINYNTNNLSVSSVIASNKTIHKNLVHQIKKHEEKY